MARQQHKLTALQVTKYTKPGLYGDGGGLTLQITKTGAKSWLFRYMVDGKSFGMGLGPTHTISLAEARQKALVARKMLIDGINPLDAKRKNQHSAALAAAKTITFDQCAEAYIMAHKASWKNSKHADQWANTIRTYASPVIGHLSVAAIDTGLVMRCLLPTWDTKTETTIRVRGRIEAVLSWATTSGYRTGENPARWKGHLKNLLATINKSSRTKHHPSLPWNRIGAFIQALREREGISARAVEFCILTACRSGEIRGARWNEFDLEDKVWIIPAERMKAKREHQVPLSEAALNLLSSLKQLSKSDIVFAGTKGQPLSDMSLTAVIRRMNGDKEKKPQWTDKNGNTVTIHGFRTTFRMWAAEATNFPREVAEHALAHQLPDPVERAYQRGTQFVKRTALMEDWATHCDKQ
jgi:integrase